MSGNTQTQTEAAIPWTATVRVEAVLTQESARPHLQEAASLAEQVFIICRPVELPVARQDGQL